MVKENNGKKQRVLFISGNHNFVVIPMKEQLEKKGYQVVIIRPELELIHDIQDKMDLVVLFTDPDTVSKKTSLVFLKDWVEEHGLKMFMIGDTQDNNAVRQWIPVNLVEQTIQRPIDVKQTLDLISFYLINLGKYVKKKILVVDDSGAALRSIKGWLESDYEVILANSGAMAIKYLATNRPDLVLLDYEMPVIDGKQVLEMIRSEQEFADIPVIFLTSKDDRKSVVDVMSLKPEGYLLKTMEPERIVSEIRHFFDKRRS